MPRAAQGAPLPPPPEVSCRPMGGGGRTTPWGPKSQRTLSISEEGWRIDTFLASHYDLNRSEVIEVLLRLAYENNLDLRKIRQGLLQQG